MTLLYIIPQRAGLSCDTPLPLSGTYEHSCTYNGSDGTRCTMAPYVQTPICEFKPTGANSGLHLHVEFFLRPHHLFVDLYLFQRPETSAL